MVTAEAQYSGSILPQVNILNLQNLLVLGQTTLLLEAVTLENTPIVYGRNSYKVPSISLQISPSVNSAPLQVKPTSKSTDSRVSLSVIKMLFSFGLFLLTALVAASPIDIQKSDSVLKVVLSASDQLAAINAEVTNTGKIDLALLTYGSLLSPAPVEKVDIYLGGMYS